MTEAAPSYAAASERLSLATTATGFMIAGVILVFVLFILLLFLFLRTNRYWGAIPASAAARDLLVPAPRPHGGLAASALPPPVLIVAGKLKGGLGCPVCLCELAEGAAARLLPACGHAFHLECIDAWLRAHVTCPLCRTAVATEEPGLEDSRIKLGGGQSNTRVGSSSSPGELAIVVRAGNGTPEEATSTTAEASEVRSWRRVLDSVAWSRVTGYRDVEQGRAPMLKAPTSS